MNRLVTVAALLLPICASAQSFEERFALPKRSLTEEGRVYMQSLLPVFQRVGRGCLTPLAAAEAKQTVKRFRLVGNVSASQTITEIEIDVQSDYAACVAERLAKVSVPRPPSVPFPIAVELAYRE